MICVTSEGGGKLRQGKFVFGDRVAPVCHLEPPGQTKGSVVEQSSGINPILLFLWQSVQPVSSSASLCRGWEISSVVE